MPSLTVAEIASLLAASAEGEPTRRITGAAALGDASDSDLAFASGEKGLAAAADSRAGCLIVPFSFDLSGPWSMIRVAEPRAAFARALQALYPVKQFVHGIHPTAVVATTAQIARDSHIAAHVSVGDNTVVESGCVVLSGCVLGDHVHVGANSFLHPNVSIYDRVRIGRCVVIHANTVIGADGFGFALVDGHYRKFPQVGTVDIQDDVEIGAGCCIDRAALGVTRVGRGTKLDNLVHVAHNCSIGEHVVVAAQTGFSGSVTVGNHAVIGGQVGIGEKAYIEPKAMVGGKAGILTSATVHAGEPVWGIPARPLRQHLKGLANVKKLPELREQILQLGQRLMNLENRLGLHEGTQREKR
jgi:UDP-3-O-[3-hydroxymyristoyl] glucosamine N-acyltransferase